MRLTRLFCLTALTLGMAKLYGALPVEGVEETRKQFIDVPLPKADQDDGDLDLDKPSIPTQISISMFLMKISPEVAADWGLDGGPAAKPETTPLKGDIPKRLTKEQSRTLITALRNQKGSEILGSMSVVMLSGNEVWGVNAKEMMFPESFQETEIDMPDQVDNSKPIIKRVLPKGAEKFNLTEAIPIFASPRTDVGVTLEATPAADPESGIIRLDLHPKWVVDRSVNTLVPMFPVIETRTQVVLRSGQTVILMSTTPALNGDYYAYKPDASTDRRPVIMFMTAEIVEDPEPETPKVEKATPAAKAPAEAKVPAKTVKEKVTP